MKDYKVELYSCEKKHVSVPPRSFPYHVHARVADSLENMIKNGVIEGDSCTEPVPQVFCVVIVPRDYGYLRVTFDGRTW